MRTPRKLLLLLVVIAVTAGCDHASKDAAKSVLEDSQVVSVAGGLLQLRLATNEGAFLGLGSALPEPARQALFLIVVPVAILWLCARFVVARPASVWLILGVGLIAGGGFANWAERLVNSGAVTDFLVLRLGPLHTGIFNLADVAIMVGAITLVLVTLERIPKRP